MFQLGVERRNLTFSGTSHLVEPHIWWNLTFGGTSHLVEPHICWWARTPAVHDGDCRCELALHVNLGTKRIYKRGARPDPTDQLEGGWQTDFSTERRATT